jgi:DNA-binding winged helix-turn-helix (wHTH) protein
MNQQSEISHFESLYPETTRFEEIEKILNFIKEGNSCQVVSVPGVGRSNLLGYLAYNRKIRIRHLGEAQKKFHFVLLNFSEVRKRSLADVNKFIFLGILNSLRERGLYKEYERINSYFKEALEFNDEMVILAGLKKTIDHLCVENNLTLVLLFERFEEYIPSLTSEFFANLRVLRNHAKYHFSCVFSLNRPLEDIIEPALFADFFEFIAGRIIYLPIMDKPGLDFRILYLEQVINKKIDKKIVDEVIQLTAGHGRLTILCLEIILSLSEQRTKNKKQLIINNQELIDYLLTQRPIRSSLFSIWNSLTPSEQQYLLEGGERQEFLEKCFLCKDGKLTIPLFEHFINCVISKTQPLEESSGIIFDENTNEIKMGHIIISDNLTASEFKLLKFLILQKDRVLEKEEIINSVWGEQKTTLGVTDQALDQLIFRLRKKIEENPNSPTHILTIKGRGFKFTM